MTTRMLNSFITFLKDNRSIILNGRVTPQFNNYTFVSPRGCSVPDYIISPVDHLMYCKEMKTLLREGFKKKVKFGPFAEPPLSPPPPPDLGPVIRLIFSLFYTNLHPSKHEGV